MALIAITHLSHPPRLGANNRGREGALTKRVVTPGRPGATHKRAQRRRGAYRYLLELFRLHTSAGALTDSYF